MSFVTVDSNFTNMIDGLDLRNLPTEFVNDSKPSIVIKRYLERKQKEHEFEVNLIPALKGQENVKANNKIEIEGEKVKRKIEQYDKQVKEILYVLGNRAKFALDKFEWSSTFERINKLKNQMRLAIEEYGTTLIQIENERTASYKNILREAYKKITKIAFKVRYEIDEFFEFEILKNNQITLENARNYSELKQQLLSQTEEMLRQYTFRLQEIKEMYIFYAKQRSEDLVTKFENKSLKDFVEENEDLKNEKQKLDDEVNKLREQTSKVPINLEEAESWLRNTQATLACLDLSAKNFVCFYKQATVVIFNRFFDELKMISDNLEVSGIVHRNSIDTVQCEIYTPSIEEMGIKFECELEKLKNSWSESIDHMTKTVRETYLFLKNVVTLWDYHFIRIDGLKYLILRDLQRTVQQNDKTAQANQMKFNVLLDTLRQESTDDKANKLFEDIKKMVASTENIYLQQFNSESLVLRKYKHYMEIAIEVLMSEMKRFVLVHPPDFERDPKKQRKRASQTSELDVNEELIPMQMIYCRFQVDAVSNWMFGLSEAINNYIENGKTEIMTAAEDWIKQETEKLENRMKIRIAFNKSKIPRAKAFVYDFRISELCFHSNRVDEHREAVQKQVIFLKNLQNENIQNCNSFLKKYEQSIDEIIKKSNNTKSLGEAQVVACSFKISTDDVNDLIKNNFNNLEISSKNVLKNSKIANIKLLQAIKMFSENGNFGLQESKDITKSMSKLYISIEKNVNGIIKEIKTQELQFLKIIETKNNDVSAKIKTLLDEYKFIEESKNKMLSLQRNIKHEVCNFKKQLYNLENNFESLQNNSQKYIGNCKYFPAFCDEFKNILEQIKNIELYLKHPEPIQMYSAVFQDSKNEKSHKNLFSLNMEGEENLMAKLNTILQDSWNSVSKFAKDFYTKHTSFNLEENKIQHTFEKYLDEILPTFRLYQVQYEIEYMKSAFNFSNIVSHFENIIENYPDCFLKEFCKIRLENFENLHKCHLKRRNEEKEIIYNFYKNIHDKLKPLYGHPNNILLLKKLEDEFENFGNDLIEKLKTFCEPYIIRLNEAFEVYKNEFEELKNNIETFRNEFQNYINNNIIKNQLEIKKEMAKEILGSNSNIEVFVAQYFETTPEKICPETSLINISIISSNNSTYCSQNNAEYFVQNLEYNLNEYTANFMEDDILNMAQKWQQRWNLSVQQIKKLYSVKYDQKNNK